jgi:hypothetical protein
MTRIDAFENLPRSIRNRKRARYICVLLHLLAILILGLMCGSELNVGAFAHPTLNAQTLDVHVPVRAALARLLGRVMPFWMITSTLLNLALLLPFEGLAGTPWLFAAIAFAIQVLAVLFSVTLPVPINNRIMRWTPDSIPQDWRAQERRWDLLHMSRTIGLIGAFALLTLSLATR